MIRKTCLIFVLMILASPLNAENINYGNVPANSFEFQGLRFGQPPLADMICTRGQCPSEQQGKIIKNNKSIVATYKKINDITHYDLIEILSPEYDFWGNSLIRVKFKISCDFEDVETCIDEVYDSLDSQYGITFIDEISVNKSPKRMSSVMYYLANSGEIIEIHHHKRRGKWELPCVKIYNKELMDELRIAVNPNYVPIEINN